MVILVDVAVELHVVIFVDCPEELVAKEVDGGLANLMPLSYRTNSAICRVLVSSLACAGNIGNMLAVAGTFQLSRFVSMVYVISSMHDPR